jgi:Aerotolerance regulator N-terminal
MPSFANPAGLWALMGVPAIIAIHFLQRKAQILPISTLFLLEKSQREAVTGRNFDRLISSIPLWMQILSALILTWLISEPRFAVARSTQRIAIVVDDSASMAAFKEDLLNSLEKNLPALQGMASEVEYTVLPSTPSTARIYAGRDLSKLIEALREWQPNFGVSDPSHALRLARSLVSAQGVVIYATDTPAPTLPFAAALLAVGKTMDNVGFTGSSFETVDGALIWRATVQNYSNTPATRTWYAEAPGISATPQTLQIPARGFTTIQSAFPAASPRIRLVLSSDSFPIDDILPLVKPSPKLINLAHDTSLSPLAEKLQRSIPNLENASLENTDLALRSYDPLDPSPTAGNAIVFVRDTTQGGDYLAGGIIAEKHPLMDGINWQSLLIRETIALDILQSDQGLLYQGKRPLIVLRTLPSIDNKPAAKQLLFNFDPRLSNIESQPALIVCLLRFCELIRAEKIAPAQINLETRQPLTIATHRLPDSPPLLLEETDATGKVLQRLETPLGALTAPATPGFQLWRQDDEIFLTSATAFADTREADFRKCGQASTLDQATAQAIQAHSMRDPWWRYWLLALIAALIASWYYTNKPSTSTLAKPILT